MTTEDLREYDPSELQAALGDAIHILPTLFVLGGGIQIGVNENYPHLGVVATIELLGLVPELDDVQLFVTPAIVPLPLAEGLGLRNTVEEEEVEA